MLVLLLPDTDAVPYTAFNSPIIIQIKRGNAKDWEKSNTILDDGELGWDKTQNKLKIGDGKTPWKKLPYIL